MTGVKAQGRGTGTLVSQVSEALRQSILTGDFSPGDKLPSEAQLTERHGVSRTVVREAVAALRSDGLVEARQGAGVFVLTGAALAGGVRGFDKAKLFSVLEVLEIRTPIEVEAAGLAALRRSPAQEEEILDRHAEVVVCAERGQSIREADFQLHLAIAQATNNPLFHAFLTTHGPSIIPRAEIVTLSLTEVERSYHAQLISEHERIALAISRGDEEEAREAMRVHLKGSQVRHRDLLQQARIGSGPSS